MTMCYIPVEQQARDRQDARFFAGILQYLVGLGVAGAAKAVEFTPGVVWVTLPGGENFTIFDNRRWVERWAMVLLPRITEVQRSGVSFSVMQSRDDDADVARNAAYAFLAPARQPIWHPVPKPLDLAALAKQDEPPQTFDYEQAFWALFKWPEAIAQAKTVLQRYEALEPNDPKT